MKKFLSPLSHFSEPQAVLFLLGWLRLLTTSLLLFFCVLADFLNLKVLQPLLDWEKILLYSFLILALEFFTIWARNREITRRQLFITLLLDIVAWSGLIAATGGAVNPAISYLLVLLSIAALSLSGIQAVVLMLLAVGLYAGIMETQPAGIHHGYMMGWHLWGMWVLFLLDAVIMLAVITLLSRALREKDRAIADYREETVRNEQLVSMGTLAANIAHELGTPLSTISILLEDSNIDDKSLLESQLERCRKALHQLKTTTLQLSASQKINTTTLVQQWIHESQLLHPQSRIEWQDSFNREITVSPMFSQAMLALLNNAIEASSKQADITVYKEGKYVLFDIRHDGDKINNDLLKVLGRQVVESSKQGLGLGYYLANASIERLGGQLQISNLEAGVLTRARFPIALLGADNEE